MNQCEMIQGVSGEKLRKLLNGPQGEELALHLVPCESCSNWVLANIDDEDSPLPAQADMGAPAATSVAGSRDNERRIELFVADYLQCH